MGNVYFSAVLLGKRGRLLIKLHGLHPSFLILARLERGLLIALAL